jgi:hypothetical protein
VAGDWRKFHNEELYDIFLIKYYSNHGRLCSASGEKKYACTVLVEITKRRRELGRHRSRWYDNVNIDFKEIGCNGVE